MRQGTRVALAGALLSVLYGTGCGALLGPRALRGSRAAYNEAIIATNSRQVLAMMVHMRYGEPSGLLAVTSVTANMKIRASTAIEAGVGAESNYRGNLVPLSAGVAYEENPTITYAPVQGEAYMREFNAPLPLDVTVPLLRAVHASPQVTTLLLRSINGIRNPDFLLDPSVAVDPRFTRLAELLSDLDRRGHTTWGRAGGDEESFALVIAGEGEAYESRLVELCELLGFSAPRDLASVRTLPVRLAIGKPEEPALHLDTRSLYEIFRIAAASVEVPPDHLESGLAPAIPPLGPAGQGLRIRRSRGHPDGAVAAARHRGWWYSIDGTDTASKLMFRIVESLISVRIADAVDQTKTTPVLTVPVSG